MTVLNHTINKNFGTSAKRSFMISMMTMVTAMSKDEEFDTSRLHEEPNIHDDFCNHDDNDEF